MSTDYPPPEGTDPGFRQNNSKVGARDEFTLPDVTPIISPKHTSWVGRYTQEFWVRLNWLLRGIAGTLVDWFVFFAEIGKAYPTAAALAFASVALPMEEKYSEEPYIGNAIHYTMEVIDPAAAAKIYAPKPVVVDPVGHAADQLLTDSTGAFLRSDAYTELKAEIEEDVQRQVRRRTYAAAGMTEDVHEIDIEIQAARDARRAAHHPPVSSPPEAPQVEQPAAPASQPEPPPEEVREPAPLP